MEDNEHDNIVIHKDMKYLDFLRADKRKQGTGFRRIPLSGNSNPTIAELCKLIEADGRSILHGKGVGESVVCMHIESFYKHGLVTQAWYEKQIARYTTKTAHPTEKSIREGIAYLIANPALAREFWAALQAAVANENE